jgi:hypothetical protein
MAGSAAEGMVLGDIDQSGNAADKDKVQALLNDGLSVDARMLWHDARAIVRQHRTRIERLALALLARQEDDPSSQKVETTAREAAECRWVFTAKVMMDGR